jgi:uracil-DNA glycosylase
LQNLHVFDIFPPSIVSRSFFNIARFRFLNAVLTETPLIRRVPLYHQPWISMSNMSLKRKASNLPTADSKKPKQQGTLTSFFGAPKVTPAAGKGASSATNGTVEVPAVKFDKDAWISKLTEEQKKLLKLEIETLDESWLVHLKDEIITPEFLELKRFLDREAASGQKVFPPREDIYSWYVPAVHAYHSFEYSLRLFRSRLTPFHTIKVVIVGQDPYHNVNQAHGLAFSVRPPTPAPPSLKNMYIALKNDYPSFSVPTNRGGLLTPWAERGVLLLNTCLTVRAHQANSHANRGWERFTQRVIDIVAAKRTRGVVFMAWGTPAGQRVRRIDGVRHLVLKSVHPSPLSAARGYYTCGHYKEANRWLVERYGEDGEIDWALVPGESTKAAKRVVEKAENGGEENKVNGEES